MDYSKLYTGLKNKKCDHILIDFKSDISVLSGGDLRTSRCLKCKEIFIK